MDVIFEFPDEVKGFARREGIRLDDVKEKLSFYLELDLVDKNCRPIKCSRVRIVVNGLHKTQKKKVFISPGRVSKKKPLLTVSSNLLLKDCSVNYLIYREN